MISYDMTKTPVVNVVDDILAYGATHGASDIHFDPREDSLMVRMRVDGDLRDYTNIQKIYERNLITRIKLLANMNITESRLPQDGAIKGTIKGIPMETRVSTLPTNEGEKCVIRILDYSRSLAGIDSLGFNERNLEKLKKMIKEPNGIILITGATGSGKSTTVYSILQVLNNKETNIITVEDPIEMNLEGLNQVQVNSEIGLDFATVLRSILRQDPNVILIGEIRDSETAKIAVRASITGHLVLSTVHTNNSLSTIERLLDMNVERYLLSSALTGIISQRLAKMLCTHCRKKEATTPYQKKIFKLALHQDVEETYVANHDGCEYCSGGYHDRIAIQEVLLINDEIRNALNEEEMKKEDLQKIVYTSDVITMLQDGLYKVLNGTTSFEEIYRIIDIDDDLDIGNVLEEILKNEGYSVSRAYSGTEAVFVLSQSRPDLILLDLMLPGLSGEEVLPYIKGIPVIVMSAKVDVDNKVELLLGGAVDYVTKPFDTKELLARITVALRVKTPSLNRTLEFEDITLDTFTYEVFIEDKKVKLTRTEYAILKLLIQNPKQVIVKSFLLEKISEDTPDCTESSLKMHISNLRKKLRDISGKDYIEAVWGIGFKMRTE